MKFVLTPVVLLALSVLSPCQVHLGTAIVPKDKFRVFIFLGHSNMDGRGETLDTTTNPRLWMWDISRIDPNPDYPSNGLAGAPRDTAWRLSRDVEAGHSRGRPATPFLRKMLAAYPDYYFGVIQLSEWESIIPRAYLSGLCWYVRMLHYVNQLLPTATVQAVVTMLGWDDGCTANNAASFDINFAAMAGQMRIDLGMPRLPVLVGQQEAGHGCDNNVQPELIARTEHIPAILAFSGIVRSSGPYVDDHHYNTEGLNKWADSAVACIKRNGWGPPLVSAIAKPPVSQGLMCRRPVGHEIRLLNGLRGELRGIGMAMVSGNQSTAMYSLSGKRLAPGNGHGIRASTGGNNH